VQCVDQVADVVRHVAEMQILPLLVARIQNLLQGFGNFDDSVGTGKRAVAQVVDGGNIVIRIDDAVRKFGQQVFQSNVRCHDRTFPEFDCLWRRILAIGVTIPLAVFNPTFDKGCRFGVAVKVDGTGKSYRFFGAGRGNTSG
jgi:hypothetical protein